MDHANLQDLIDNIGDGSLDEEQAWALCYKATKHFQQRLKDHPFLTRFDSFADFELIKTGEICQISKKGFATEKANDDDGGDVELPAGASLIAIDSSKPTGDYTSNSSASSGQQVSHHRSVKPTLPPPVVPSKNWLCAGSGYNAVKISRWGNRNRSGSKSPPPPPQISDDKKDVVLDGQDATTVPVSLGSNYNRNPPHSGESDSPHENTDYTEPKGDKVGYEGTEHEEYPTIKGAANAESKKGVSLRPAWMSFVNHWAPPPSSCLQASVNVQRNLSLPILNDRQPPLTNLRCGTSSKVISSDGSTATRTQQGSDCPADSSTSCDPHSKNIRGSVKDRAAFFSQVTDDVVLETRPWMVEKATLFDKTRKSPQSVKETAAVFGASVSPSHTPVSDDNQNVETELLYSLGQVLRQATDSRTATEQQWSSEFKSLIVNLSGIKKHRPKPTFQDILTVCSMRLKDTTDTNDYYNTVLRNWTSQYKQDHTCLNQPSSPFVGDTTSSCKVGKENTTVEDTCRGNDSHHFLKSTEEVIAMDASTQDTTKDVTSPRMNSNLQEPTEEVNFLTINDSLQPTLEEVTSPGTGNKVQDTTEGVPVFGGTFDLALKNYSFLDPHHNNLPDKHVEKESVQINTSADMAGEVSSVVIGITPADSNRNSLLNTEEIMSDNEEYTPSPMDSNLKRSPQEPELNSHKSPCPDASYAETPPPPAMETHLEEVIPLLDTHLDVGNKTHSISIQMSNSEHRKTTSADADPGEIKSRAPYTEPEETKSPSPVMTFNKLKTSFLETDEEVTGEQPLVMEFETTRETGLEVIEPPLSADSESFPGTGLEDKGPSPETDSKDEEPPPDTDERKLPGTVSEDKGSLLVSGSEDKGLPPETDSKDEEPPPDTDERKLPEIISDDKGSPSDVGLGETSPSETETSSEDEELFPNTVSEVEGPSPETCSNDKRPPPDTDDRKLPETGTEDERPPPDTDDRKLPETISEDERSPPDTDERKLPETGTEDERPSSATGSKDKEPPPETDSQDKGILPDKGLEDNEPLPETDSKDNGILPEEDSKDKNPTPLMGLVDKGTPSEMTPENKGMLLQIRWEDKELLPEIGSKDKGTYAQLDSEPKCIPISDTNSGERKPSPRNDSEQKSLATDSGEGILLKHTFEEKKTGHPGRIILTDEAYKEQTRGLQGDVDNLALCNADKDISSLPTDTEYINLPTAPENPNSILPTDSYLRLPSKPENTNLNLQDNPNNYDSTLPAEIQNSDAHTDNAIKDQHILSETVRDLTLQSQARRVCESLTQPTRENNSASKLDCVSSVHKPELISQYKKGPPVLPKTKCTILDDCKNSINLEPQSNVQTGQRDHNGDINLQHDTILDAADKASPNTLSPRLIKWGNVSECWEAKLNVSEIKKKIGIEDKFESLPRFKSSTKKTDEDSAESRQKRVSNSEDQTNQTECVKVEEPPEINNPITVHWGNVPEIWSAALSVKQVKEKMGIKEPPLIRPKRFRSLVTQPPDESDDEFKEFGDDVRGEYRGDDSGVNLTDNSSPRENSPERSESVAMTESKLWLKISQMREMMYALETQVKNERAERLEMKAEIEVHYNMDRGPSENVDMDGVDMTIFKDCVDGESECITDVGNTGTGTGTEYSETQSLSYLLTTDELDKGVEAVCPGIDSNNAETIRQTDKEKTKPNEAGTSNSEMDFSVISSIADSLDGSTKSATQPGPIEDNGVSFTHWLLSVALSYMTVSQWRLTKYLAANNVSEQNNIKLSGTKPDSETTTSPIVQSNVPNTTSIEEDNSEALTDSGTASESATTIDTTSTIPSTTQSDMSLSSSEGVEAVKDLIDHFSPLCDTTDCTTRDKHHESSNTNQSEVETQQKDVTLATSIYNKVLSTLRLSRMSKCLIPATHLGVVSLITYCSVNQLFSPDELIALAMFYVHLMQDVTVSNLANLLVLYIGVDLFSNPDFYAYLTSLPHNISMSGIQAYLPDIPAYMAYIQAHLTDIQAYVTGAFDTERITNFTTEHFLNPIQRLR